MKNRTVLLVVGLAAATFCFMVGISGAVFWLVSTATRPATTTADTFMTALKEEKYGQAYELLSLRGQDGISLEDLQQQSRLQGSPIDTWSWYAVSITGNEADLKGKVTFEQKQRRSLHLSLVWIDDRWLIDGFEWESSE